MKNERSLLNIIKYTPSLFLITVVILITSYLSYQNKQDLEIQKEKIKLELIESNKDRINLNLQTVNKFLNNQVIKANKTIQIDLKTKINNAINIATNIYNKNKNTLSKDEIIVNIKNRIESLTFDNEGAFSIHLIENKNILKPLDRENKIGLVFNKKDSMGNFSVENSIKNFKTNGQEFVVWNTFELNDKSKKFKRLGIVKKFKPYSFVIMASINMDDFEKKLKKDLIDNIKSLEYKNTEYIFVIDYKGDVLLTKTKVSNISQMNKNSPFPKLFNNFVNSIDEDLYIEYNYPVNEQNHAKISYLRKLINFNWVIGAGFNIDDISESILNRQNILEIEYESHLYVTLQISGVMTILLLILSALISKFSGNLFREYRDSLNNKNLILNKAQSQAKIGSWEHVFEREQLNWSDEVYRIFELDLKSTLTFETFMNIVHPDDKENTFLTFQKSVIDHTEYYLEHRLLFPDGRIKYIVERAEHFYDINNKHIRTIGMIQDITEIHQKRRELKTVIQEAPNPMILHDEDGKVIMLNKAWMESSGFSHEDIPTINDWIEKTNDDEKKISYLKEHINSLYKITEKLDEGEFSFFNKNKNLLTWKIWSAPLGIIDGKKRVITSAMDITELKNKEKMIIRQSSHAAMGEMIGMIAHQWRQPLSVISTSITGLQIRKETGILNDDLFNSTCESINNNAQYLSKTIDDFKNFIKGDRVKNLFNLNDNIDSLMNLILGSIKSNNILVILDLEDDININGYDNELNQCLINIFNNAKDALLESKNETRLIFISSKKIDTHVLIKIKDNAGGIPESIISKVFEPYFTTKHESQGTGLGLHMTYKLIVEGMNGDIEVNNVRYKNEGETFNGAEFILTIPMS